MMNEDKDPKSVTIARLLDVLKKGRITVEHGLLRWSSNYTFLITIAHEDVTTTAVYKPQKGERPLWDFPDGTLCYREFAAFLTSQELDWQLVPPTVLRDGPHGLGSVQFFIDHDPEINYFTFEETLKPQLLRFMAFDYVTNNADRKGGHCLLDNQEHIWGIDHGITFHAAPKLRTVIWDYADQRIPDTILSDLEKLCKSLEDGAGTYRQSLQKLLSAREIMAFQNRVRFLLQCKRYPQPGNGPNYPWPPV